MALLNPNNIFEYAGYVIAGALALYGLVSRQGSQVREDNMKISQNLIENLKTTVDQQKETIATTNTKLDQTTKELHQMQGRNSVLESLFNGNENSILAFLKQTPVLMEIAHENKEFSKANSEAITGLTLVIKDMVDKITPHITTQK